MLCNLYVLSLAHTHTGDSLEVSCAVHLLYLFLDCTITDWAIRCVSTRAEAGAVDVIKTIVICVEATESV